MPFGLAEEVVVVGARERLQHGRVMGHAHTTVRAAGFFLLELLTE